MTSGNQLNHLAPTPTWPTQLNHLTTHLHSPLLPVGIMTWRESQVKRSDLRRSTAFTVMLMCSSRSLTSTTPLWTRSCRALGAQNGLRDGAKSKALGLVPAPPQTKANQRKQHLGSGGGGPRMSACFEDFIARLCVKNKKNTESLFSWLIWRKAGPRRTTSVTRERRIWSLG